jgi:hypothetical protein
MGWLRGDSSSILNLLHFLECHHEMASLSSCTLIIVKHYLGSINDDDDNSMDRLWEVDGSSEKGMWEARLKICVGILPNIAASREVRSYRNDYSLQRVFKVMAQRV